MWRKFGRRQVKTTVAIILAMFFTSTQVPELAYIDWREKTAVSAQLWRVTDRFVIS